MKNVFLADKRCEFFINLRQRIMKRFRAWSDRCKNRVLLIVNRIFKDALVL
ncbi:MAG: hypothetical protein ACYC3B_00785 [Sedimentisphaerales bacterium]